MELNPALEVGICTTTSGVVTEPYHHAKLASCVLYTVLAGNSDTVKLQSELVSVASVGLMYS